ncbi:NAD(P)-dependent oxidoreductase [Candidatus Collierbacteria bacterium]|nr:NAD(P)-dependent oxidoreductase [Candidatus Collierbacteria bacterium]
MEKRVIFVTGATGFIGGRVIEKLSNDNKNTVIAGVHNWSNAARIGRFPIIMRHCDVLNLPSLKKTLNGVTHIIHCAAGSDEIIIKGTSNILNAAMGLKVKRLINLSSAAVYGKISGLIDESVVPNPIDQYGKAKLCGEKECFKYMLQRVPIVILRPSIVYGPFSQKWTIGIGRQILRKKIGLSSGFEGKCNLLYVDDLIDAIFLSLHKEEAVSETFNVNGPEIVSWNDYFRIFNRLLSSEALISIKHTEYLRLMVAANFLGPVKIAAKLALAKQESLIRFIYRRFQLMRKIMDGVENEIKLNINSSDLRLFQLRAIYETKKINRVLKFKPRTSIETGLKKTIAWMKHVEII